MVREDIHKRTELMRAQHKEIYEVFASFLKMLTPQIIAANENNIKEQFAYLSHIIYVHTTLEDEVLYPLLLTCGDEKLMSLARAYQDEMSGITKLFIDYKNRWMVDGAIIGAIDEFIAETKRLYELLGKRAKERK